MISKPQGFLAPNPSANPNINLTEIPKIPTEIRQQISLYSGVFTPM